MMLKEKIRFSYSFEVAYRKAQRTSTNSMEKFLSQIKNPKQVVHIALVGKYVELQDAYKSILESFYTCRISK